MPTFGTLGWNSETGYTGELGDTTSGLVNFYARSYDPMAGSWLSADPYRGSLREPQSLARYSYVTNSPLNVGDAFGYAAKARAKSNKLSKSSKCDMGLLCPAPQNPSITIAEWQKCCAVTKPQDNWRQNDWNHTRALNGLSLNVSQRQQLLGVITVLLAATCFVATLGGCAIAGAAGGAACALVVALTPGSNADYWGCATNAAAPAAAAGASSIFRSLLHNAALRAAQAGTTSTAPVLKGPIPNVVPRNAFERLVLEEAMGQPGTQIMSDLVDAPRLVANYGPGEWVKMQWVHQSLDGTTTAVHGS